MDVNGMIIGRESCKLGNRVMFRIPKNYTIESDDWGWIRYCKDFKQTP
jgi:hypothetical protein